ncbi:MAG: hypothetical protein V7K69_02530 [Nostoc sp.]
MLNFRDEVDENRFYIQMNQGQKDTLVRFNSQSIQAPPKGL